MSLLQIVVAVMCLFFLICVIMQIKKGRLLLRYALLWFALAAIVLIVALFPDLAYIASDILGFVTPSNFIFLIALFFLLAFCLSLSIIVSGQARKIKSLVQNLALIENNMRHIDE